jgi:hypothetical protein
MPITFHSLLRAAAVACFVVYAIWNAFWIWHAAIPPSLFLALTGLPAPTTGGTRSVRHLLAANWAESLRSNAMTVPIISLLAACLICLAWQGVRGRRLSLPRWMGWSWGIVLTLAWILKLCGDTQYW